MPIRIFCSNKTEYPINNNAINLKFKVLLGLIPFLQNIIIFQYIILNKKIKSKKSGIKFYYSCHFRTLFQSTAF
jgi:hypothetical protein